MSESNELFEEFIKIWYRKLPQSGKSLWPLLDVKLPGLPQNVPALIDSGANNSILHEDIVKLLGFSEDENKSNITGKSASGSYKSYALQPIQIEILSHKFNSQFIVIKNNRNLPWPCILGHNTIFKFAKIEFRSFKGYFRMAFRTDVN